MKVLIANHEPVNWGYGMVAMTPFLSNLYLSGYQSIILTTNSEVEDGREARKTCPLLLAFLGGESSDETAVCQRAWEDRWIAASVGIAEAATPKNRIPLSPRNGESSEKAGSGSRADGFSGPRKGGWEPVGPSGRKHCARRARLEANACILSNRREAKKLISAKDSNSTREGHPMDTSEKLIKVWLWLLAPAEQLHVASHGTVRLIVELKLKSVARSLSGGIHNEG